MKIEIIVEVDPVNADPDHSTGITDEAYERVCNKLSWLGDIEDITKVSE